MLWFMFARVPLLELLFSSVCSGGMLLSCAVDVVLGTALPLCFKFSCFIPFHFSRAIF